MECWAHAAAIRRRLRNGSSLKGGGSSSDITTSTSKSSSSSSSRKSSLNTSETSVSNMSPGGPTGEITQTRTHPPNHMPHVCVVGAGMAGLKTADVLASHGFKVTILEGRDRIGGRIHQSSHLGHLVDLGPNWIHGTESNPILDLAQVTNSTCFDPPMDRPALLYGEDGVLIDTRVSVERIRKVWDIIEEAYDYSRKKEIASDLSLLDFISSRLCQETYSKEARRQMLQIAQLWGDVIGEPIERQSLKFFWLEECIDSGNTFLASTYQAILDVVAKPVLAKVSLQLNTTVTSVTAGKTPQGSPSVTLTTANGNGDTLTFDEVVLTTPLGWLKRNLDAFSPPLSPDLLTAIGNISYGRLEKVYLTFSRSWWCDETNASIPGSSAFLAQYLSPAYAPLTNPSRWYVGSTSLASLPAPHAHPTLLYYLNGPCAAHVVSLVANLSPTSPEYLAKLTEFFKPYFSLLPHYDSASPACSPTAALATNWMNDELAGNGSYCNFLTSPPEHGVELDADIDALRLGLPERGIWFAGEATAPFVALGTVTGAYWSGEAVGGRIAGVYGK